MELSMVSVMDCSYMDSEHVLFKFECHQGSLVVDVLVVSHRAVDVVFSEENLTEIYTIKNSAIGSRQGRKRVHSRRHKGSGKTYNTIATRRES
jgi:hypothetical protein